MHHTGICIWSPVLCPLGRRISRAIDGVHVVVMPPMHRMPVHFVINNVRGAAAVDSLLHCSLQRLIPCLGLSCQHADSTHVVI